MMPPFTKVAYKSTEKAFKKTTGNKKTMTAVASKGRLGLFLSACLVVAATADDASPRGPALRGDVLALAPQDPGLFPGDALASDGGAPPDDSAGEAGPPVARRLQDVQDGWTIHEGATLGRRFRIGAIFQATHLSVCKEACLMNDECGSIDFSEDGECQLGDSSQDTALLSSETFSHYDAPARDTFDGMTRQELRNEVDQLVELALRLAGANDALGNAVQNAEELALRLAGALPSAADDASLHGPSLGRDVALAPQDPGLSPEDALASDGGAPPDDSAGEAGPPVARRLQVHSEAGGWTKFEGKYLEGHNTLTLDGGEGGGDVDYCKALCISFEWCVNFDVTTTKCLLSDHEADGDALAPAGDRDPRFDHYRLDRAQLTQPVWTKHEGKYLEGHNTLALDGRGGGDVEYCKAICVSLPWCVNIDVMTNRPKCFLSDHEAGGDVLAPHGTQDSRFDHYTLDRVQLAYDAFDPYASAMQDVCDAFRVTAAIDGPISTDYSDYGLGADSFLPYCDVSGRYVSGRYASAMQDVCDAFRVTAFRPLNVYSDFGEGADSFLPYCDVSGRYDFDDMFENYQQEFGSDLTELDLSRWNIHRHTFNGRNYPASTDNMFHDSGWDDINKCPCIEGDPGVWRRWCPDADWDLTLAGNPCTHSEAAGRDDLICEPTTSPGRL